MRNFTYVERRTCIILSSAEFGELPNPDVDLLFPHNIGSSDAPKLLRENDHISIFTSPPPLGRAHAGLKDRITRVDRIQHGAPLH